MTFQVKARLTSKSVPSRSMKQQASANLCATVGFRGRIIAYLATISTRRFLARPSSVVLDATGDKLATPMGVSRSEAGSGLPLHIFGDRD